MSKLKFNLTLGSSCALTIQDITGWVGSTNLDGFYQDSASVVPKDSYKIKQGYFKNVILYNKYGAAPVVVNSTESFRIILDEDPTYSVNFPPEVYALTQDGVFTIKRVFIITEEFYNLEKLTTRFDDRKIYYSDGVGIYYVDGSAPPVLVTMTQFLDNIDPFVGMVSTIKIVSTCFINMCYFNLINTLLTASATACPTPNSILLTNERDYIYMVLEAIKYNKEQGNIAEIQRIIEATNTCGGVCKDVSTDDCGCNG